VYHLLSPDAVARGQRGAEAEIRGPEEFKKFVREIRGAFPDIKVKVEDIFAADDRVVLRRPSKTSARRFAANYCRLFLIPAAPLVH
jgi:SnoaL-like domain